MKTAQNGTKIMMSVAKINFTTEYKWNAPLLSNVLIFMLPDGTSINLSNMAMLWTVYFWYYSLF